MKFGASLPHHGGLASADAIRTVAKLAEDEGYDSVWVSDHLLVPKREDLSTYRVLYEPLITLSFIASLAPSLILGTSVVLLPLRNPVLLAKQAASLDVLTGGKLILGVGSGYLEQEFEALGVPFSKRGSMLNEGVKTVKSLWAKDESKSIGQFDGEWFEPKPKQHNGPPILIGGNSDIALRRAASIGDGWHPMGVSPSQIETGTKKIAKIRLAKSGFRIVPKNIVEVTKERTLEVFHEYWSASSKLERSPRISLRGSSSQLIEAIQNYVGAGVEHFVFNQPSAITFETLCEQLKVLAREVMPSFR